jgi:hypothetical protein
MKDLTNIEIAALFQLFLNREWVKAVEWWEARNEEESIHNLAIRFEGGAREADRYGYATNAIDLYCLAGFCWELAWWLNKTPGIMTVQIAARCYGEASLIFARLSPEIEFEGGAEVKGKLRDILS